MWSVLHEATALAQCLVDESDITVLEISQAAVDHLRTLRRRAAREVVAFDECGAQPSRCGIEGDADTGDAPADHQHVERVGVGAGPQGIQHRATLERQFRFRHRLG